MDSTECYLGLGLVLGALVGGLILGGETKRRAALTKIRALRKEKEKADDILKKAKDKRREGYAELPIALLLFLLGIALFILCLYLLTGELGL